MNGRVIFTLVTICLVGYATGARILGILPMGAKSHNIIGAAYMKALAAAGHEVTVVSPYTLKSPPKNYRDIELTGMLEATPHW